MTQTQVDLLAQRQAERHRIEQHYAAQAREHAERHGLSLTCQDKPREQHGTCVGLGDATGISLQSRARRERTNSGLGCLCTCHDDEARGKEATV